MAVQSDTSRIQYAGNNSTTTSYAVPFVFQENSHLKAIARTSAGVESVVTLTNHTGAGNVNGGTVRTAVAVPATSTLTIYREVPATQTTTYAEGGDFPAASHERALDKLTQIAQQNQRQIGASLRLTEANPIAALPLPTAAGQHVLATAGSGTAPSFQSLGSLAIGPVIATGSTTPRSVQDRFADMANVADFGAVGGATNDIAAFVAASDTGKHVYVPSGTYTITVSTQAEATSIMAMMSRLHLFCTSLTVNFAAGVFTFPTRTEFRVTNGDRLTVQGAAPTVLTYSSLGTVTSNASQNHDVTIAVTDASSVAANDYIIIRPATSDGITAGDTTGPFGGIWRVTGVVGNNITVKNTTALASLSGATISCPTGGVRIVKMNTVLSYTGTNSIGFYVNCQMGADSANSAGFKNLALVGSWSVGNSTTNIAGVYLEYGASVNLSGEFGITSFSGMGVYALYSGVVSATNTVASGNGSNGFYALNASSFQLVRVQATGNTATGIVSAGNSNVAASQSAASGNGGSGYLSSFQSSIIAQYGDARFNDDDGFSSRDNGFIMAEFGRAFNNDSRGVNTLRGGMVDFTSGTTGSNTLGNLVETAVSNRIAGSTNYSVPAARVRVSKAINFGSISAHTVATDTITATGALIGDIVAVGYNAADVAGVIVTGRVSANDTVTIYAANVTAGSVTLGNRTYYAAVLNRD